LRGAVKIQFLKRLQRAIVVDGATLSKKNGVEDNGGLLKDSLERPFPCNILRKLWQWSRNVA
jgi:hypothetical protein